MANDLIDRQALLERLKDVENSMIWDAQSCELLFAFRRFINKAPATEAVKVVRCAQCIYSNSCEIEGMLLGDGMENPYCAGGERRVDNAAD